MINLAFIPNWFSGYGLMSELVFALITLFVSIYSFKIYKLSGQHESKFFGIAFLLFSLSYFSQFFINLAVIFQLHEPLVSIIQFQNLITLDNLAIFSHIIFFTLGLATLIYIIIDIKNILIYASLMLFYVLFILLSIDKLYFFYIVSSILLIIISMYYLKNYFEYKRKRTILMVIAFLSLLFGQVHFIFSINHEVFYVIGVFLELIAYILILINLLKVLKK